VAVIRLIRGTGVPARSAIESLRGRALAGAAVAAPFAALPSSCGGGALVSAAIFVGTPPMMPRAAGRTAAGAAAKALTQYLGCVLGEEPRP